MATLRIGKRERRDDPGTLQQVQLAHLSGDAQANPHWNLDSTSYPFSVQAGSMLGREVADYDLDHAFQRGS